VLINFCESSKQFISAINIHANTLTIYLNTRYTLNHKIGTEVQGYANYIYKHFNLSINPRADHSYHVADYHPESSHITNLPHFHFVFGNTIDQDIFFQFIEATTKYQDKDTGLRIEHEEKALNYAKNQGFGPLRFMRQTIEATLEEAGFPQIIPASHLDLFLIKPKNLKLLETKFYEQFNKNSKSSSYTIINFFQMKVSKQHDFPLTTIPNYQSLSQATCPQISSQAKEQDTRALATDIISIITLGGPLLLGFGFWIKKQLQQPAPRQQQQVSQRLLR
jgi:hypothetical protein